MRAETDTFRRAKQLRGAMSLPEVLLWQALRRRNADGMRWRKQHPMSRLVLDFYCPAATLAVEIDGEAHNRGDAPDRDARRDAWLASQGVHVLRVAAADVLRADGLDNAVRGIVAVAQGQMIKADSNQVPPPPSAA